MTSVSLAPETFIDAADRLRTIRSVLSQLPCRTEVLANHGVLGDLGEQLDTLLRGGDRHLSTAGDQLDGVADTLARTADELIAVDRFLR